MGDATALYSNSKLAKARSRKTAMLKHRNAPKATRHRGGSIAGQEMVVARLTHERDEALLRETANSEILRLISTSPGDLELVFRTILEHATRICNANFGTLFRFDGENLYPAAQFNTPTALLEAQMRRGPFKPLPGSAFDHLVRTKQVIHIADVAAEGIPSMAARLGGALSLVAVPMLKDDALIGTILIYHQEVRPFTDKQIELVMNFAAQAAIAIENTRLLNELRQRTTDLGEALEQQTATSEVLRVISSSPGDLEPVFQTMLENAVRICAARYGVLFLAEGDTYRVVAMRNVPESYREVRKRKPTFRYSPSHPLARVAATKQMLQIADLQADASYAESDPSSYRAMVGLAGARTMLNVPMLRENELWTDRNLPAGGFAFH
jgi:hypothetical protein